jgi:hypothetical protein
MQDHNRRFLGQVLLVFGVPAIIGGYLLAFTEPGALSIFAGMGSVIAGVLVLLRVPVVVALAIGVAIGVACAGMMAQDLQGRAS